MDEEDYRAILEVLQANLREIGAADLADPRAYMIRDGETGELRALPPEKLLIEMLQAFERFLAVRDRATYDKALYTMNRHVDGAIKDVIVVASDDDREGVSLSRAPELERVRGDLSNLIGRLLESPPRPRFL